MGAACETRGKHALNRFSEAQWVRSVSGWWRSWRMREWQSLPALAPCTLKGAAPTAAVVVLALVAVGPWYGLPGSCSWCPICSPSIQDVLLGTGLPLLWQRLIEGVGGILVPGWTLTSSSCQLQCCLFICLFDSDLNVDLLEPFFKDWVRRCNITSTLRGHPPLHWSKWQVCYWQALTSVGSRFHPWKAK